MKQYIKYLCLAILLPVAIMVIPAEWLARQCPNSYRFKNEYMNENASNVKGLVFGGSRMYYSVNPKYLGDNVFSLGQVSQPLAMDEWLFFKWSKDYSSLQYIIIEINNCNVTQGSLDNGSEWYRGIYYNLYMDYERKEFISKYDFEISNFSTFKNKVLKGAVHLFLGYNHLDCDSTGWGTGYKTRSPEDEFDVKNSANVAIGRHNTTNYSNCPTNKKSLESMAEFCKDHNIRMILITAPVTPEYYRLINPEQMRLEKDVVSDLVDNYKVEYKDYANDARFSGLDFYDADHLSHKGSQKLTMMIKNDFKL